MNDFVISLAIFYIEIIIGILIGKTFKSYNKNLREGLSFILIYILTPPIIFFSFFLTSISLNLSIILLIIFLELFLVFSTQLIAYLFFLRKRKKESNKRSGSILMLVAFPNAMLFPLPIVLSLFGSDFILILVIFSLSAMIVRATWLTYMCIYFGEGSESDLKSNIKKLFLFPPTFTLIICSFLLLFDLNFRYPLLYLIDDVASGLVSILGAILIGVLIVNVHLEKIKDYRRDFLLVIAIRVIFSLGLFLILTELINFSLKIRGEILIILLLLFVNPPAVSNTAYAQIFKLDEEFTAFSVIVITLLALIYVPLILFFGFVLF